MELDQTLPEVQPGWAIGLSVSHSEDLARYGVTDTHVNMALAEIARAVLIAQSRLVYGGHLDDNGYTVFLTREIQRFGRRNRPFTGYVPFPVHRKMKTRKITDRIEDLSVLGTYVFLDETGDVMDPLTDRGSKAERVSKGMERRALTAARETMARNVDARVALGGQRTGFKGRLPGVVEETIYAIRDRKPVFIAGGFGGVAADIAVALGIDRDNWLNVDPSAAYLDELKDTAAAAGWIPGSNGLTDEENQQLAITYRASEIASLIVAGLSRLKRTL